MKSHIRKKMAHGKIEFCASGDYYVKYFTCK